MEQWGPGKTTRDCFLGGSFGQVLREKRGKTYRRGNQAIQLTHHFPQSNTGAAGLPPDCSLSSVRWKSPITVKFYWSSFPHLIISQACLLSSSPCYHIEKSSVSSFHWMPETLQINSLLCCAKLLQLCLTLCDPMDCTLPGSSVHGILQKRILEWIATLSSKGSSQPRDQTLVSCIAGRFFTIWAMREAP